MSTAVVSATCLKQDIEQYVVTAAVLWSGRGGVVSRRANVLLMCLQWASIAALERWEAKEHEVTFDDDVLRVFFPSEEEAIWKNCTVRSARSRHTTTLVTSAS